MDFIKDADCTKETPVRLGVPDAPIYGKGIKLKPRVDGRTDSEHFKKIYLPELLPLEEYDLIVVLISGGKDSVACYLKLLELGVRFDCKGMKDFQQQLGKLQNPDDFVESCAKELAARLLRMVVKRTPVGQYPASSGKKGGTLRRGWTGEKRASAQGYADSLTVNHFGDTYVIEIVNPVEYASYVEYGHRTANHSGWVKGQFMMTISEQELQKIAPKVLENKIKKYLGGLGK